METRPLADLINDLFKTRRKPDGTEYTNVEVSRGIKELGLGDLDSSYLAKLRRGELKNPSRDVLMRLCVFFRIQANYFFPELEEFCTPQHDPTTDPEVQASMAFRAMGLDPETQTHLEGIIRTIRGRKAD